MGLLEAKLLYLMFSPLFSNVATCFPLVMDNVFFPMSSLMLIVHLSDNRPCNRQRVSADLVLMVRELSSVTFGHLYLFFFEVCVCVWVVCVREFECS